MKRATWPPYRTVRELIHLHYGCRAIIMGGGPTLAECWDQVPRRPGDVLISANAHGARFLDERGQLEQLGYVVCLDKLESKLRPYGKPIISRHMWADYRILDCPAQMSGIAAAWVARLMGCSPIVLFGMDCYNGEGTYWHDHKAESTGRFAPEKVHVQRWRALALKAPANYQPAGGPLLKFFPPVDGVEYRDVPSLEQLCAEVAGTYVQLREEIEVTGRAFPAGAVLELKKAEAVNLVKKKKARARAGA